MGLTNQQAQAAYAAGSVAVTAGAGTGKTHMLSERYHYFLQQGFSPLQIVAVTFTEKAATELRSRIRQTIAQNLSDRSDLLAELEAAQISTFHALAARICREHPEMANVPPDFLIQDNIDSPIWLAEAFAAAMEQLPSDYYETVPFSVMREVLQTLLTDPLTAQTALQRDRTDWLPVLQDFCQTLLDTISDHPDWQSACDILSTLTGPTGDKRELARQEALQLAQAFEATTDSSYLSRVTQISLRGGSCKKWVDKESFDAVKAAIDSLKSHAKSALSRLEKLEPREEDDTEAMLSTIRAAFNHTWHFLQTAKYQQRLLDFNDIEIQALQALSSPSVQDYYAQRWRVYLIDEFQDTNPTQGQLLERLTQNAIITIVGDIKQAIYGFRRADVRVFQDWQTRIHGTEPPVELSLSFRTHRSLLTQINQVFAPVLADLHQSLDAHRTETIEPTPNIQLYQVIVDDEYKKDKNVDTTIDACRRVEAQKVADLIEEMLSAPILVQDKPSNRLRPIHPGDIAILSHTWEPLELYGSAIAHRNIPILQAGGGNLLDTREAKDAWAMLQFLADPVDSLALAAVLRSPFFAISDRILYSFAQSRPEKTSWWKHLQNAEDSILNRAQSILSQLLIARRTEAPTRLLQQCDRLTGYTAVIANLPGGDRRMADWSGFIELVRSLEDGSFDVLTTVRRLKRIQTAAVKIPRPALDGGDAVNLMTIHASKGLEWPVVVVVNLSRSSSNHFTSVRFDPELGIAIKLENEDGNKQASALYSLLEQRQAADNDEEAKRVLYVALTRARDRLVLTSASDSGGSLDILKPGLTDNIKPHLIPFHPDHTRPIPPTTPELQPSSTQILTHVVGLGLSQLPVTALSDYAFCPKRFEFRYVQGHPGYRESHGTEPDAMATGILAHKALELGIREFDGLKKYAIAHSDDQIHDALDCAERFYQAPDFSKCREQALTFEYPVYLAISGIIFNGKVDLVGQDYVLDFKTDRAIHPEHHQFQLWAYSKAAQKPIAHIAYLRHDRLHTFTSAELAKLESQATGLINQIADGNTAPTPSAAACGMCPYAEICTSSWESPSNVSE
jgi:ATP-dependent helicase/nuclease subunit A